MVGNVLIDNVLIIGTGLIGGSFAKALRDRHLVNKVVGFGRRKEPLIEGVKVGVLDEVAEDLNSAISVADVIVLGVPTLSIKNYLPIIAKYKKDSSIVTDVASVKGEVAKVIIESFGRMPSWFVLGHPIAGAEKSGILAANSDLFVNHKVIITPHSSTDPIAIQLVSTLWQNIGANVEMMSIEQHDSVLAATSHLPHALAFSLVDTLAKLDSNNDVFKFAAGGFRDFTRIASSDPVMWHDIMLANKDAILLAMENFRCTFDDLESAIKNEDSSTIMDMFSRAKFARDNFANQSQANSVPTRLFQKHQQEDES